MTPDRVNLRSALRWSIDAGEGVLALRLAGALWRFWHAFGQVSDGRELTERGPGDAGGSNRADRTVHGPWGRPEVWPTGRPIAATARRPLPGADRDRRGCRRPRVHRRRVLQFRASRRSSRLIRRSSGGPSSTPRRNAIGSLGTSAAPPERRGDEPSPPWGAARRTRRPTTCCSDLATFERLDDRQYHAMTAASLAWAAFAGGDVGLQPAARSSRSSSRSR